MSSSGGAALAGSPSAFFGSPFFASPSAFFGGMMITFTRELAGGVVPGGAPETSATSRFMS